MDNWKLVITGGCGMVGRAVARQAAILGAQIAIVDIASAPPEDVRKEPAGEGLLYIGGVDLTDEDQASAAFARIQHHFGGIDALFNVAGTFRWETIRNGSLATWDRLYAVNLRTAVVACQAAIPLLEASNAGAIVNVGANAATRAGLGMAAYAASKAGIARLTESLAEELMGRVTVNAVLPSIIDTPQNRADMPDADFSRWVTPTEVADAMLFLARTRAITGALLPVTGLV